MYFRSTVRLIPVTKKPPGTQNGLFLHTEKNMESQSWQRWIDTWPVLLFSVFEGLDQSLRFAFVGPPVRDVRPQITMTTRNVVFIGHYHWVADGPQVSKSYHFLKSAHEQSECNQRMRDILLLFCDCKTPQKISIFPWRIHIKSKNLNTESSTNLWGVDTSKSQIIILIFSTNRAEE